MKAKSAKRPLTKIGPSVLASAVMAAMLAPLHSAADTECEVLAEDTAIVDVHGLPVDAGNVDAIAYRHVDAKVVVYE